MDGNGEVNNVAATVKLGQADEAERAEGNKTERCILSELSLRSEQQLLRSSQPTPPSFGLPSPMNLIYNYTIVFEVHALSVLIDMS